MALKLANWQLISVFYEHVLFQLLLLLSNLEFSRTVTVQEMHLFPCKSLHTILKFP